MIIEEISFKFLFKVQITYENTSTVYSNMTGQHIFEVQGIGKLTVSECTFILYPNLNIFPVLARKIMIKIKGR